jgi:hypothetical protein
MRRRTSESFPRRNLRPGSCCKTAKIGVAWKKYFGPDVSEIFQGVLVNFLFFSAENHRKNLEIFSLEYCFDVRLISNVFMQVSLHFSHLSPVSVKFTHLMRLES